jgi:putative serine/threonine protein kinase
LRSEPIAKIICYPRLEERELEQRIEEMKGLGLLGLYSYGSKIIDRVRVLGKGCVGIVMKGKIESYPVAVKIRRIDSDRADMKHEAEMLKLANGVGIGPTLLAVSNNFLLMEFVNGIPLAEWIEGLKGRNSRKILKRVIKRLIEDCYKLDELGLDHGELSRAPKNVIVDRRNRPVIVDFETASLNRRCSNVTSMSQYLLIGSEVAKKVRRILRIRSLRRLKHALRRYKEQRCKENIDSILKIVT